MQHLQKLEHLWTNSTNANTDVADKRVSSLCLWCHDDTSSHVCDHTGVDLPMSLQGFLCLELGTTLVTNYGLLTSCKTTKDKSVDVYYIFTHMQHIWNSCMKWREKKRHLKVKVETKLDFMVTIHKMQP